MNLNKKDLISIGVAIIVIATSVLLFFFPDVVGYDKSYVAIEDKKSVIESNNANITQNDSQIMSLDESASMLKTQAQDVKIRADREKVILNDVPKGLDMSSLLISMEKQAQVDKVTLKVDYANIQKNAMAPNNLEPSRNPGAEPGSVEPQSGPGNSYQDFSSGMQTAIVPLEIEGGYKNVRQYISYLDETGLIRPSSINMISEGKTVKAKINLNVMYGEVGR